MLVSKHKNVTVKKSPTAAEDRGRNRMNFYKFVPGQGAAILAAALFVLIGSGPFAPGASFWSKETGSVFTPILLVSI
ncbi:hypothetical protein ATO1_02195 [Phaeobacter sp. 22II1-1F12B]|nr:hypothetical protein ATO1_02195 [Phaeobacter sp. 22II1-1F12B]